MRWTVFFIFAYVMIGLHIGLGGHWTLRGAAPNLGLLAAVFIALHASRQAALLGALMIGFLQDLATAQPLGVYAFSYALMAMLAVQVTGAVLRDSIAIQSGMTLVGGLIVTVGVLVRAMFHGLEGSTAALLLSAAYSTILAVPILWILTRLKGPFAFNPRRV
jgi:rod shape-determining protein MreD